MNATKKRDSYREQTQQNESLLARLCCKKNTRTVPSHETIELGPLDLNLVEEVPHLTPTANELDIKGRPYKRWSTKKKMIAMGIPIAVLLLIGPITYAFFPTDTPPRVPPFLGGSRNNTSIKTTQSLYSLSTELVPTSSSLLYTEKECKIYRTSCYLVPLGNKCASFQRECKVTNLYSDGTNHTTVQHTQVPAEPYVAENGKCLIDIQEEESIEEDTFYYIIRKIKCDGVTGGPVSKYPEYYDLSERFFVDGDFQDSYLINLSKIIYRSDKCPTKNSDFSYPVTRTRQYFIGQTEISSDFSIPFNTTRSDQPIIYNLEGNPVYTGTGVTINYNSKERKSLFPLLPTLPSHCHQNVNLTASHYYSDTSTQFPCSTTDSKIGLKIFLHCYREYYHIDGITFQRLGVVAHAYPYEPEYPTKTWFEEENCPSWLREQNPHITCIKHLQYGKKTPYGYDHDVFFQQVRPFNEVPFKHEPRRFKFDWKFEDSIPSDLQASFRTQVEEDFYPHILGIKGGSTPHTLVLTIRVISFPEDSLTIAHMLTSTLSKGLFSHSATIEINQSYKNNTDFLYQSKVPTHEVLHALGMSNQQIPSHLLVTNETGIWFLGPTTMKAYGGPVPFTSEGGGHFSQNIIDKVWPAQPYAEKKASGTKVFPLNYCFLQDYGWAVRKGSCPESLV